PCLAHIPIELISSRRAAYTGVARHVNETDKHGPEIYMQSFLNRLSAFLSLQTGWGPYIRGFTGKLILSPT
ncbi:MAG: hypothetical protein ACREX3_15910, partial [Gammaproteobacteria bacterium]